MEPGQIVCPRCGQTDQIQRLTVVVQSGITVGSYAGAATSAGYMAGEHGGAISMAGQSRLAGGSHTLQAQRLAPPPRPAYDSATLWKSVARSGAAILFGLWLMSIGDALFGLPICVVALYYAIKAYRTDQGARADHQQYLAQWQREMAVWSRAYYCARDDTVFLPGSDDSAAAEDLRFFLQIHAEDERRQR